MKNCRTCRALIAECAAREKAADSAVSAFANSLASDWYYAALRTIAIDAVIERRLAHEDLLKHQRRHANKN